MKTCKVLLFALAVLLFGVAEMAQAQFKVGPHLGIDLDGGDLFIGGNVIVPVGIQVGEEVLSFNGDASYWLSGEGFDLFIIDANLVYPFQFDTFGAYAGAGLVISFFSYDIPDFGDFDDFFSKTAGVAASETDTDFGLNLKGGAEFQAGNLLPFGEVGFYIKDGGFLYIQGGLRFKLGDG